MKRTSVFILVAVLGLIGFNLLIHKSFTGMRWDLTENKLYTLSEGSKAILQNLSKDIELTLYLSEETSKDLPALRAYARRVQELLQEYKALSAGKLTVTVVDPKPFSEQEDEANFAGLQAIPVGAANDSLFFGLIGRVKGPAGSQEDNPFDADPPVLKEEIVPFFQPDKEQYLEYTLSQLVFNLNRDAPPVVGIISGLDVNGGVDMLRQTRTPAWTFMQFVEELFDVDFIAADAVQIDDNIGVLLLIHPRDLSEQTLFAIDQFALRGGRVIAFVDPVAEQDQPMQMMAAAPVSSSDLGPLAATWGVSLKKAAVLADFKNSLVVGVGPQRQPVRHIGLLGLSEESLAGEDIVMAGLESVNFSSAGVLEQVEGKTTKVTPLIRSSNEAGILDASLFARLENPQTLMDNFMPTGEQYLLAARIEGKAVTAFPDGIQIEEEAVPEQDEAVPEQDMVSEQSELEPIAGDQDAAATADESTEAASEAEEPVAMMTRTMLPQLTSTDNLNVIIVADTDILSDRLWVQVQEFFGQRIASPWANNGDLLVNILDNLSGNADLITIRSRGRYSRPFEVVEELRRQAEEKFADQQRELEASLQEAEVKLSELQQLRQGDDSTVLSPEQEQALLSFQQEKLVIRKALREVQRGLDQEIEDLGTRLKLINIGLVPLLLTVFVVTLALVRRKRRAT